MNDPIRTRHAPNARRHLEPAPDPTPTRPLTAPLTDAQPGVSSPGQLRASRDLAGLNRSQGATTTGLLMAVITVYEEGTTPPSQTRLTTLGGARGWRWMSIKVNAGYCRRAALRRVLCPPILAAARPRRPLAPSSPQNVSHRLVVDWFVSGSSASETSRGGMTPYNSSGVHISAVHNACRVSAFIMTGSLFISAEIDGADKLKLARRARSSRSCLPVHTSREAITCLSRHRSRTVTPSRPRLFSVPRLGAGHRSVSPMGARNPTDLGVCSGRHSDTRCDLPNSCRLYLCELGISAPGWRSPVRSRCGARRWPGVGCVVPCHRKERETDRTAQTAEFVRFGAYPEFPGLLEPPRELSLTGTMQDTAESGSP